MRVSVTEPAAEQTAPNLDAWLPSAVAQAVTRCRPTATCSGPDAIATAIDASTLGVRTYAAIDGPGLLRTAEALFQAARLELPIVMTVSRPAALTPHEGRADHGYAMALRDCGWIQLYPSGPQDAVDTHIQAFRIAEAASVPVMVCLDEFASGDGAEDVQVPSRDKVGEFLDRGECRQPGKLESGPEDPEIHTEMRYLAHLGQAAGRRVIRDVARDFRACFGRNSGGLLASRHAHDATNVVLALGSAFEAVSEVTEELRSDRMRIGAIAIRSFRPFPAQELAGALAHCERVVVVERAVAVGVGGIVSADVRAALGPRPVQVHTAIAGLGGRPISPKSLRLLLRRAARDDLQAVSFLDLKRELVPREPDRVPSGRTRATPIPGARPKLSWQRESATLL